MKELLFEGTATALITPFLKDGVDFKALEKLIDFQLDGGVNALVILGTTGEPATMTEHEKEMTVRLAVHRVGGRIPVIVGASSNCTTTAIQNAKNAERWGADGLLVATPYYNKCTQAGLVAHFATIAKATKLPIIAYNVPSRTGVNMLPETFAKIAKFQNVVGIKEASGNMAQITRLASLVKDDVAIYSGDDALTVPIMAVGGKGVISVASNVVPKVVSDMTRQYKTGNHTAALNTQLALLPLVETLFCEVNPIPIKRACALLGLSTGRPRLPLTPASKKTTLKLRQELAKFVEF